MNDYQNMIDRITGTVCENSTEGQNYILIGDNSSGKSEILRNVVEKKRNQAIYFIDSVNRTFDTNKIELESKAYKNVKLDSEYVITERISPFNFNLRDTFKVATSIEQLFDKYSVRINSMCRLFLDRDIRIVRENLEVGLVENKVIIDRIETKFSSGYQAVVRLFCEILFFCDVMESKKWNRGFVVIDEIDEYLSPKYSAKILNFLQEQFSQLNFLVTTHSLDLVEFTINTNLIILRDLTYEIYTSEQLENTVSVDDIFTTLFFDENMIHRSNNDLNDEKLRVLLNLKISELWDEKAQEELQAMDYEKLQPHQKMIYKQIEEW